MKKPPPKGAAVVLVAGSRAAAEEEFWSDADEGAMHIALERLNAELDAAFRNSSLEIRSDSAERAVQIAVGCLSYFSTYQPPSSPQFRKIGRKAARNELNNLAGSAEALIERFDALSATAMDALADHEFQVGAQRYIAKISSDLSALAIAARRDADVSNVRGKGREKNQHAIGAARIVIGAFEAITDCDADRPANISRKHNHDKPRGLEPLVRKIFDVLGIEANAKSAVDAALKERSKQAKKKSNGEGPLGRRHTGEEYFERIRLTELAERSPKFWRR